MLKFNAQKAIALVLAVVLVPLTIPISAAERSPAAVPLGSVVAMGTVQLRGMTLTGEGTVFAGDRVRSAHESFANLVLKGGRQVELGPDTDVIVSGGAVASLVMVSGSIALSIPAQSPLRVEIAPYEVVVDGASAELSVMGPETVGVRVRDGSLLVRNTTTKESFVLSAGQEKLMGRSNGVIADPISVIAANIPSRIPTGPAPLPTPAPQGSNMSSGAWAAIVAAVAGGAAAAAFVLGRSGKVDESKLTAANARVTDLTSKNSGLTSSIAGLNSQISSLTGDVAGLNSQISSLNSTNTAVASQLVNVRNATSLEISSLQSQLRGVEIELATELTKNAIVAASLSAADSAALTTEADAILTEIKDAQAQITTLTTELADIKAQLAATPFNELQIDDPTVKAVAIPEGAGPKTTALLQRQNTAEQSLSDQRARVDNAQTRIQQLQDDSIAKGVISIVKFEKPALVAPALVPPYVASLSVPIF